MSLKAITLAAGNWTLVSRARGGRKLYIRPNPSTIAAYVLIGTIASDPDAYSSLVNPATVWSDGYYDRVLVSDTDDVWLSTNAALLSITVIEE